MEDFLIFVRYIVPMLSMKQQEALSGARGRLDAIGGYL